MCEPTTIAMIATAASSGMQVVGALQQGRAAQAVANNNAMLADIEASDAQRRGELEAQEAQRRAASLKSSQRAGFAGHGLDVGYGTVADVQDQTDFFGQADAATARDNAARASWTSKNQAAMYRYQGKTAMRNAKLQAFSTVLGTGGQVASKWSR